VSILMEAIPEAKFILKTKRSRLESSLSDFQVKDTKDITRVCNEICQTYAKHRVVLVTINERVRLAALYHFIYDLSK